MNNNETIQVKNYQLDAAFYQELIQQNILRPYLKYVYSSFYLMQIARY